MTSHGNSMTDTATTVSAWGALLSPAWLPSLKYTSEIAALLLPILGAAWLVTQITIKTLTYLRDKRDGR